jgi:radical SAM superfamily enzyme YgiQ (UPF0313 family)
MLKAGFPSLNILLCTSIDVKALRLSDNYFVPPTGIAYISSSLKAAGFNVYTLNFLNESKNKASVEEILARIIVKHSINAIGCGGLAINWQGIKFIFDIAKNINSNIVTFMGGSLVTHSPFEAMTLIPSADYGVIGEGEITTCELLKSHFDSTVDISSVDGIIYRHNNETVQTRERTDVPNLDELPFPDYEGLYGDLIRKHSCASLVSSRSCPYSCTFCSNSGGKQYRIRSMDSIFNEIDWLVKTFQIRKLVLADELFTVNKKRMIDFAKKIKPYNLDWVAWVRIDVNWTLEIFKFMKDAGCKIISPGLEHVDATILSSMNKRTDVAMIERFLNMATEANLRIIGHFIIGDTEETVETVNKLFSWLHNNAEILGRFNITPITLYPGSLLYQKAVKEGKINPLDHIRNNCPIVNVSKLPDWVYYPLMQTGIVREMKLIFKKRLKVDFYINEEKEYSIHLRCQICLEKHIIHIQPHKLTDFNFKFYNHTCKWCNEEWKFNIFEAYTTWIDEELSKILNEGNCVVWPASRHYEDVLNYSYTLQKGKYFLINSDPKITHNSHGKQVLTPSQLNDDVNNIIVFSRAYKEILDACLYEYGYDNDKILMFHEIGIKDKNIG